MSFLLSWLPKLLFGLLDRLGWRQAGVEAQRRKQAEQTLEGVERGRHGAREADEKLEEGKTPEQIVRENDGKWD